MNGADFYVCPQHIGTGGYESCCNCGGWQPDDPDYGRLCTEAKQEEAYCVRQLHSMGTDMNALAAYITKMAGQRRRLVRVLLTRFGWSQREVAAELGISQAAVWKLLKKEKVKETRPP